jgi:hypothetical protein
MTAKSAVLVLKIVLNGLFFKGERKPCEEVGGRVKGDLSY